MQKCLQKWKKMKSLTSKRDKKSLELSMRSSWVRRTDTRASEFIRACANILHQTHSAMCAKDSISFDFFFLRRWSYHSCCQLGNGRLIKAWLDTAVNHAHTNKRKHKHMAGYVYLIHDLTLFNQSHSSAFPALWALGTSRKTVRSEGRAWRSWRGARITNLL